MILYRKKKMKRFSVFTVVLAVLGLSVVASTLYARCQSGCDDPSSPCSTSKPYLIQGSIDSRRACFQNHDENGFGIDPGQCATYNEGCDTCVCRFHLPYLWLSCSCDKE